MNLKNLIEVHHSKYFIAFHFSTAYTVKWKVQYSYVVMQLKLEMYLAGKSHKDLTILYQTEILMLLMNNQIHVNDVHVCLLSWLKPMAAS